MQLTFRQKQALFHDGYVHLPGVVPAVLVDQALRAINHALGQEGMNKDDLPRLRSQSYAPGLRDQPPIADLFNATPLRELAQSAVGPLRPVRGGQIALRFPTLADPPHMNQPHVDGTYSPLNGVKQGAVQHFTALAAVFLSDVPGPDLGNFTVWPGAHHALEAFLRENGPEAMIDGLPPAVPLPQPRQILARAGDAVLTHYQLPHTVGPHTGPSIRYAIFFRLNHVNHPDHTDLSPLTHIWREWEGMGEFTRQTFDSTATAG